MKNTNFAIVDEEKIKEYLPTKHVIPECMKIYEEILEVKFTEIPSE